MQPRTIILALAALLTVSLAANAQTKRPKASVKKPAQKPLTVTLVRWPYT